MAAKPSSEEPFLSLGLVAPMGARNSRNSSSLLCSSRLQTEQQQVRDRSGPYCAVYAYKLSNSKSVIVLVPRSF